MELAGQRNGPWTDGEIDLVVAAYFELLAEEVRGGRPVKAATVRNLRDLLPERSTGSIEFKMGNISAVLDELDLPWIEGYKPYKNYQAALRRAVALRLGSRVGETIAEYQANALPGTSPTRRTIDELLVSPPSVPASGRRRSIGLTTSGLGALRDLQNRKLGKAGEEFVFEAERFTLAQRGRPDLAAQVVWTSEELGDGAGYDIASFRVDGTPLHIEVKTTNLGVRTPFHITRREVDVSKSEPDVWALYRVFDFRSDPRMYRLSGSVESSARLEPSVFLGVPR